MKDLDEILGNCRIDDETGCMVWAGGTRNGKYPSVYAPCARRDGKLTVQNGRKAVWQLANGKALPNGWRAFGTCENKMCLNPKHIKAMTCADRGQVVKKSGEWKNKVNRITANRIIGMARTKFTPEMAREIMTSPATGKELSVKLGINRTSISRLRQGKIQSVKPVGGIFSGLLR